MLEKEVKKLLAPGCRITNDELHLIIMYCPTHRAQAWDQLLGQSQTHRDLPKSAVKPVSSGMGI